MRRHSYILALALALVSVSAQAQTVGGSLEHDLEASSFERTDERLTTHLAYVLRCGNQAQFTTGDGWTLHVISAIYKDGSKQDYSWTPKPVEKFIDFQFCAEAEKGRIFADLEVLIPADLPPGDYNLEAEAFATTTHATGETYTTDSLGAGYTLASVPAGSYGSSAQEAPATPAEVDIPGLGAPLLVLGVLASGTLRRRQP